MTSLTENSRRPFISRWAMRQKRDAMGNPIPGRLIPYWGGRKQSKYMPGPTPSSKATLIADEPLVIKNIRQ